MPLNDPVPSTATDVFNRNVQDIDRIVNETANVTTRTGRVMESFPMSTERATDAANVAAASASTASTQAGIATTKANEAAGSVLTAQQAAQTALATGNYAGQWSTLSGAYNAGISVEHNNIFYALRSNTSNIASIQPGVSAEWIAINGANLGTAATRDVGTAAGNVMEVGAFGYGRYKIQAPDLNDDYVNRATTLSIGASRANSPEGGASILKASSYQTSGNTRIAQDFTGVDSGGRYYRYSGLSGTFSQWYEYRTEKNTIVDGSGFIKSASPIVKLYSDKIELNDYKEIEGCSFEYVSTGHYIIKGAPLLSRNGWYIETLKDRNNNIYFTLDYEELKDGLHVKTYEPDYSTGRATNGAPVDINEGRFVTLRFEEDPSLYPAPKEPEAAE